MVIHSQRPSDRAALKFAMSLSLWTGLVMFFMKTGAYLMTGSAAILSDASESVVHVAAVCFAAYSLKLSYKPADEGHLYGHSKIAFFSAGFEGAMIILAGIYIIYESIHKWMTGLHLENLGAGTLLTAAAALINGALGWYLLRTGRRANSLIIEANGKHVLTDCWTSAAVLTGLALTLFTGWMPFDPICAICMALNILYSGAGLMKSAFTGLMDSASPEDQRQVRDILEREARQHGVTYHELRMRNVGDGHWIEVHLLFPSETMLESAHRTATHIEQVIEKSLDSQAHVTTHLECESDHEFAHQPQPEDNPAEPLPLKPDHRK